jgi:hypothetical protein
MLPRSVTPASSEARLDSESLYERHLLALTSPHEPSGASGVVMLARRTEVWSVKLR